MMVFYNIIIIFYIENIDDDLVTVNSIALNELSDNSHINDKNENIINSNTFLSKKRKY